MIPIKKEYSTGIKYRLQNGNLHREDGPAVEWKNGYKAWYINGILHRELNLPAIEWSNGDKSYLVNGVYHREDGPAIEHIDGFKSYFIHGKPLSKEEFNEKVKMIPIKRKCLNRIEYRLSNGNLHREDGPAIEHTEGSKFHYFNGNLHREGDLPAVEYSNGTKEWRIHGKLHREDGPAFEGLNGNGHKEWWIEGKLHREDGPAIEKPNGFKEWWIAGEKVFPLKYSIKNILYKIRTTAAIINEKMEISNHQIDDIMTNNSNSKCSSIEEKIEINTSIITIKI